MPDVSFGSLLVVAGVAVLAPLLLGFVPGVRIPAAVAEIVAGAALGPSGLGWIEIDLPVQVLGLIGLAFLLFLAGLEIDLRQLGGRPLALAAAGYGLTLLIGAGLGLVLHGAGWIGSPLLLAIALSATSLGLVVPVMKDAGVLDEPAGRMTVAGATVADFAAIVLLSLAFSASGMSTGGRLVLLGAFAALVVTTAVVMLTAGHSMRLGDVLVRLQDTTAEIRVRLAVLLLIAFVVLAERFGLESILGAFMAGAVVAAVDPMDSESSSHPQFRTKLEALGYGFLIPVFFVSSGAKLDVTGLVADPSALLRVPVFLVALLLVRGVPAALYLPVLGARSTIAAGLLQATSLPFLVTASMIGLETGRISAVTAAALVCAGLLSVMVFPVAALAVLTPAGDARAAAAAPGTPPAGSGTAPPPGSAETPAPHC